MIVHDIMYFIEKQTTVVIRHEETPVSSVIRQSNSSNISAVESNRSRSKTISTNTSEGESATNSSSQISASASAGFNFLQSIKDLTHQELYRANPLGLLGKEIISVTGTTHCPEPIPPTEDDDTNLNTISSSPNKLSPINENEPQQLHFALNEEDRIQMQRRRSTIAYFTEAALPPCPGEFISDDLQPHLFSQPTPGTMVADFIPDTMTINVFEVFIYAWGVFAFFFDMVTDLVLAHAYYLEGAYWLFILTLMCVILPNLTLSVFSLVWYIEGSQLKAAANENQTSIDEINSADDILLEQDGQVNNKNSAIAPLREKRGTYCQTDDDHISRLKHRTEILDKHREQHGPTQRKHFQLSAATANVLTWIIRIIILVLQLDLCLK